jgi:hypothetical protein
MSEKINPEQETAKFLSRIFFRGYPYLATYIGSKVYHLMLLPSSVPAKDLLEITAEQTRRNCLNNCLVLNDRTFLYIDVDPEASIYWPPYSTNFVAHKLFPCIEFFLDEEYRQRDRWLHQFVDGSRGEDHLLEDPKKGGRPAIQDELKKLAGRSREGVPQGLSKCTRCGGWFGECLDTRREFSSQVLKVYCRCQNNNYCASCGEPLAEFKLNANHYVQDGDEIIFTPEFRALNHICPDHAPWPGYEIFPM